MDTISPLGTFTNPVRCKGIQAANQYLSQLLGPEGQFLQFQRLRNVGEGIFGNIVDEYLVESISDSFNILVYVDCYHQLSEKNPPLNLLIQPLGGKKVKTQFEEMRMWVELTKKFSENFNQAFPDHAVYISSKAYKLSEIGPTLYAFHDAFNFPYAYWNLTTIMKASKQISTELRGFCSAHPLLLESAEEIEGIINTFHFDISHIFKSNLGEALYQIESIHTVEKYPFDWWIKVIFLGNTEVEDNARYTEIDYLESKNNQISKKTNRRLILDFLSKINILQGLALQFIFIMIMIALIVLSYIIVF
jgi:hypothetical protein